MLPILQKARMFATATTINFHPSLIFPAKAIANQSGDSYVAQNNGELLALLKNIRQAWKQSEWQYSSLLQYGNNYGRKKFHKTCSTILFFVWPV